MEYFKDLISLIDCFLGNLAIIYMIKYFSCREIVINRKLIIVCGIFEIIFSIIGHFGILEDSLIPMLVIIIGVLIYTYKFQFIKKFFYTINAFIVLIIFSDILYLFVSGISSEAIFLENSKNFVGTMDNIITILSLLFDISIIYFIRRKIHENLYFTIRKSDSLILIITIIVSFIIIFVMDELKQITIYDAFSDRCIIFLISECGIVMNVSILISMFKSKSAYYYKNMSEINEHYMEMQLKHFEAYKNSQIETRRIKHDMKNHIMCINNLLEQDKIVELKSYVKELNETIGGIDKNFKTGNIIVDSIINEKYTLIKKENISFSVNGYINEIEIQPIDICTIFANAMDNAIEASVKEKDKSKRKIQIIIKDNKNFMFITFENNIVFKEQNFRNKFKTTKKDKVNHGFGILNMKHAIEKYNGDLEIKIYDDKFKVEMVLPKK